MGGHDYMGETVDEDVCGDFFDHIDDLLDFPEEEIEGIEGEEVGLENNWSNASNVLIDSNSLFPCNENQNTKDFLPTELAVPYEDIVQMEWLSNFVEDSFSAGSIGVDENVLATLNNNNAATKEPHQFTASSPVSVLESSSSSSSSSPSSSSSSGNNSYCGTSLPLCAETFVPGRARTKRPRPPPISPKPNIQSSSPDTVLFFSTQPENFGESDVPKDVDEKKKKKKKKNETFQNQLAGQQPTAVRKCLHCEITKTPQWRAGPLGPKTLCNACGVRYKSGRLFPEYRPAASPTFVPSLHSNSHKKVVEMRMMSAQKEAPPPEFVPINKHFLDYD